MADPTAAAPRLRRILHVLPAAAVEGGAALDELARDLEVEPETVLGDLKEVTARSLYLPPGPADDLQIQITARRVRVWTKGAFTRPVKLLPREALALGLGLRALEAEEGGGAGEVGDAPDGEIGASTAGRGPAAALRVRLERHLATASTDELQAVFEPAPEPDPDDIPGTLFSAARRRRPCRILYVKAGVGEPERRVVHPWSVVRAEGRWYVLGPDPAAEDDAARAFRMDRIVEARLADGSFEVPDDFDPSGYVDRGRLFRADDATEVVVRYSPRIARWICEKPWAGELVAGSEEHPDGSLVVRHRVADPRWLVGHVLRYGPDAEVLEPHRFRERIRQRVETLAG